MSTTTQQRQPSAATSDIGESLGCEPLQLQLQGSYYAARLCMAVHDMHDVHVFAGCIPFVRQLVCLASKLKRFQPCDNGWQCCVQSLLWLISPAAVLCHAASVCVQAYWTWCAGLG
jgi:hypothetical protein